MIFCEFAEFYCNSCKTCYDDCKKKVGVGMYKQCQTEQSARRQREMELGLLRMMERKHFSEISVAELCQELGVPRKAFYRYFDSKEDALHALLDHTLMEMENVYMAYPEGKGPVDSQKAMERLFREWYDRRELINVLEHCGMLGVLTERAIHFSDEHNTIPTVFHTEDPQMNHYATTFVNAGLMAILFQWHCSGYATSVEDMAKLALRLFREPLFAPKRK